MSRSLPHSSIERASRELEDADGERTRTTGINVRESLSETKGPLMRNSQNVCSNFENVLLQVLAVDGMNEERMGAGGWVTLDPNSSIRSISPTRLHFCTPLVSASNSSNRSSASPAGIDK